MSLWRFLLITAISIYSASTFAKTTAKEAYKLLYGKPAVIEKPDPQSTDVPSGLETLEESKDKSWIKFSGHQEGWNELSVFKVGNREIVIEIQVGCGPDCDYQIEAYEISVKNKLKKVTPDLLPMTELRKAHRQPGYRVNPSGEKSISVFAPEFEEVPEAPLGDLRVRGTKFIFQRPK